MLLLQLTRHSSGPGAYSYVVLTGGGGGTRPCALASAPESTSNPSLPRRLQHLASLPHGEVVCAVTIAPAPSGRAPSPCAPRSGGGGSVSPSKPDVAADGDSVAVSPSTRIPHFAYTGGRGCVKLWDLDAIAGTSPRDVVALASFDCLRSESYVRSIKLFPVGCDVCVL